MKENFKQILIRSVGLALATAFGGTALGAIGGDWVFGMLIGIGSAFAVAITMIGVSIAWNGVLSAEAISNAFRAAVSKAAEDNEMIQDSLEVEEDGEFDFEDIDWELVEDEEQP